MTQRIKKCIERVGYSISPIKINNKKSEEINNHEQKTKKSTGKRESESQQQKELHIYGNPDSDLYSTGVYDYGICEILWSVNNELDNPSTSLFGAVQHA